jgi:hypothetical protein
MILNTFETMFLFFILCSLNYGINAQQIYVETGFSTAFFKNYENNLGENTLDLKYRKSYASFLESGFRFDVYEDKLKIALGLGYNNYKINTGFYAGDVSIPISYDLNYVALKIGAIFNILNKPKFKIQIHSHVSIDALVTGTSRYRNVSINLYKENTFDRRLLRFHRGLSTEYIFSNKIAIYLSYNVAGSLRDKDSDSTIGERYSLHTNTFSVGLLFSTSEYKNQLWKRLNK